MSVADLSRKGSAGEGSHARPEGVTCPHYDAPPGEKRCRQYLKCGACARPDEFMCVEWLKANGHPVPPQPAAPSTELASEAKAPTKPATDLFGNPNPDFRPARAEAPTPKGIATPTPVATPTSAETTPVVDVDQLRGFTAEDIDSFRALGVEVQLHSEVYGDVWLVPAYTGQDRKEITPEHAATLARVMSVFPGSYVVSFEKTAKEAKP